MTCMFLFCKKNTYTLKKVEVCLALQSANQTNPSALRGPILNIRTNTQEMVETKLLLFLFI